MSNPPFALPAAIVDYIKIRDDRWAVLKATVAAGRTPSPQDREFVRTANKCVREMVALTPGPHTPVLDPLAARVEQFLCDVITELLTRFEYEIRAAKRGQSPPSILQHVG